MGWVWLDYLEVCFFFFLSLGILEIFMILTYGVGVIVSKCELQNGIFFSFYYWFGALISNLQTDGNCSVLMWVNMQWKSLWMEFGDCIRWELGAFSLSFHPVNNVGYWLWWCLGCKRKENTWWFYLILHHPFPFCYSIRIYFWLGYQNASDYKYRN